MTKKAVLINDLSGLGKCSLTAAIPVLSVMGIQACPMPTAVLTSQTGFKSFFCNDCTDKLDYYTSEWKKLGFQPDGIYTGFLSSEKQVDKILDFINSFETENTLVLVDPVMGDGGKAYKTYTKELCSRMVELVKVADIITPNLTEAAILLGEEYPTASMRSSEIKSWLVRLSKQGAKIVVITSVNLADGGMSTVGYDKENNSFWKIKNDYVPAHYSGTGDMFTSVLIGGLLKGDSLPIAMNRATAFTELTVKTTYSYQTPWTDGLMLEGQLPWLTSYQELRDYTNL